MKNILCKFGIHEYVTIDKVTVSSLYRDIKREILRDKNIKDNYNTTFAESVKIGFLFRPDSIKKVCIKCGKKKDTITSTEKEIKDMCEKIIEEREKALKLFNK